MNTSRIKYPRTLHLPRSPGATSEDKMLNSDEMTKNFYGKYQLITEKMDGENTTLYCDYMHARSLDSRHHSSRDWVKRFQSEIGHNIPDRWRFCGENLFAKHSISYDNLDSYFYGFSIWDENNICLDTETTKEWFELLGIQHVPIISHYYSICNEWDFYIYDLAEEVVKQGKEGIVIRNRDSFHFDDFKTNVAKYVRANHVTTDKHWAHQEIIPNKLKVEI